MKGLNGGPCDPRPYTNVGCCSKRLKPEVAQWFLDDQKRKRFKPLVWPYRVKSYLALVSLAILSTAAATFDYILVSEWLNIKQVFDQLICRFL